VDLGFSTIWASNHGGRQLETAPATIDVLPSIRNAIGPNVQILLDGGIQRGTDISKAIALGADGIGVGMFTSRTGSCLVCFVAHFMDPIDYHFF
jgi:L-lactate dehydrogenase (cytochrome)